MIGGQAAIIKTAGSYVEQMIVKRQAGIKISLRPPANRSRMSHLASLRKELDAARDALQNPPKIAAGESRPVTTRTTPDDDDSADEPAQPEPPTGDTPEGPVESAGRRDHSSEALVRLLKGQMPAFFYCDAAMDVPQALKLVQEIQAQGDPGPWPQLLQGRQASGSQQAAGHSRSERWSFGNRSAHGRRPEDCSAQESIARLECPSPSSHGHRRRQFCSAPRTCRRCLGTNFLWYQAATAVKYGAPVPEALEAITLRPAKLLGIEALAGSIEPGKDADLVILTGDPLKISTWVQTTLVRGQVVYEARRTANCNTCSKGQRRRWAHDEEDEYPASVCFGVGRRARFFAGPPHAYKARRIWNRQRSAD